jgi:hypothetical protein
MAKGASADAAAARTKDGSDGQAAQAAIVGGDPARERGLPFLGGHGTLLVTVVGDPQG